MKTITHPTALLLAVSLSFPMMSLAQPINRCDELAAHPENPDNPTAVTGVKFEEIQTETAIVACKKAVADNPQSPRYQFQLGRAYDANEDYSTAIKWYRKAAEQGSAGAQYNLGYMYFEGQGVEQSYQTAVKWYRKAAEQGSAGAQYNLGYMYFEGQGVEQSYQTATKWYRKAAEQGYAPAQNSLGWMYEYGKGVEESSQEAAKWYHKAAEQGIAQAQCNLGIIYDRKQSYQEATKWYRKAAEQGNAMAQYFLGLRHYNGYKVRKNYILAYAWYNEAMINGFEIAANSLRGLEQQMTREQIAVAQMINPLEVDEYGKPKKKVTKKPSKPKAPKTPTESVVGTAFLVNQQYLLSNYHVIKSCQSLRVANAGFQSSVTVVKSDKRNDLALLKADNSHAHSLTLSSEYSAKQGDNVIAMGYPYGEILGNDVKLSTGSISALSGLGNDASMYQITAPVQPGNSGGPLLNDEGQVIGIVTARLTKELESENVNFAVKSNVARLFLDGNNVRYQTSGSGSWFKPDTAKIAKKAKKAIVQVICKQ